MFSWRLPSWIVPVQHGWRRENRGGSPEAIVGARAVWGDLYCTFPLTWVESLDFSSHLP